MYKAPVEQIAFALNNIVDFKSDIEQGHYGDLSDDLVYAILEQAGKFASEEIAPMHKVGDENPSHLQDDVVTTPLGWKALYNHWAESGWNSLSAGEDYGGQGLPNLISVATQEMWNGASAGFGLCPMLTMGAIEALEAHASQEIKEQYLPKMISGEWTGSMNLTEPQAGSDLSGLKAKAIPQNDGTYRIFGQKIYITYGEHDMTDNIIHLVLARLPDAPEGTRGISMFVVPKFLLKEDGTPAQRNDVFCNGIEHKLGIHASPTCTMIFGDGFTSPYDADGAVGWLVGEENRGLNCMFTMMNNARLMVGAQAVGIAEAATQLATNYANERKQGLAQGADRSKGMSAIIGHPDIRRNLMTMKALTAASRAICYSCAQALDMAKMAPEADDRTQWAERAAVLTPLAKSFASDCSEKVATIGIQIHGGMGYIEETGAARYLRDSKITQIYEGTNGIQAIDLVTRKLGLSQGKAVDCLFDEWEGHIQNIVASNDKVFGNMGICLADALAALRNTTQWMRAQIQDQNMEKALASATPYQELFSLVCGGSLLAKAAYQAAKEAKQTPVETSSIATARFFAENSVVTSAALEKIICQASEQFADLNEEVLSA